jgi:AcrR family transcriptional regulator
MATAEEGLREVDDGLREPEEGLRERKKRQTREAIAAAAMELFQERGFDAVTVADVAQHADVSEKTVFNYFPTKEELVFQGGAARREELIESVAKRRRGLSIVQPFRDWTMEHLDLIETQSVEETLAVPRLVMGSQTLRNRLFLAWEEEAVILAPVIAEQAEEDDQLVPMIVARTLAWTHRMIYRTAFMRLLAGEDRHWVVADLRLQANRAYNILEQGLGSYAR